MPTAAEIRQMTEAEIQHALNEAKAELFALRFQLEVGQLENPLRMRTVRKDIARYKTVLRERQLAAALIMQEEEDAQ
jgi:large subunit ribosomal protein L29